MKTKLKRPTDKHLYALRRSMQSNKSLQDNVYLHSDVRMLAESDYRSLHDLLNICMDLRDGVTLFE